MTAFKLRFVLTGLVAAGIATAASAEPAVTPTKEVRYGDLNLASTAGVNELNARIRRAVSAVCDTDGSRDINSLQISFACRKAALVAAQSKAEVAIASARSGSAYAANESRLPVTAN